jgi:hypothetical protein
LLSMGTSRRVHFNHRPRSCGMDSLVLRWTARNRLH